jgi:hypothetical protein
LIIALPVAAQSGDRGGGRNVPGDSGSSSTASIASRGIASSSSTSTVSSTSRDYSSSSPSYIGSSSGASSGYTPKLQGTSFSTPYSYYMFQDFYWYLRTAYNMNPYYFTRFYRNSEPLITPQMLKLTLRQPMALSSRMLVAIDSLEAMLQDRQAGKAVDKRALVAKSQEIRELAKQIRQDQALSYIDLRKDKNILKDDSSDVLSPETITKLRDLATELNRQLKYMYNLSSTSTVTINSFSEPSLESLAKGIERLSKAIESSSKRL